MSESSAQLILASGSRAGLVAAIRTGYYVIGRDRGCQIRPKSRSVSRKHCLLHWETPTDSEPRFRIFDLDSTSGTRVNGTRIPARTWVELIDGAELRCGKITFALAIAAAGNADSRCSLDDREAPTGETADAATAANASMLEGDAWQEIDIASFLQVAPTVTQKAGHDDIRANASNPAPQGTESGIFESDEDFSDDETAEDSDQSSSSINAAPQMTDSKNPNPEANQDFGNRHATEKNPDHEKNQGTQKSPSLNATDSRLVDRNQIKIFAALVMTIALFGLGGYQVMQFWQGPDVRIVDGID
ncbi:Forkhead-associated protein [Rhodopirellula islandica]|uniref:Forkhead-associated protein n=1 Tax=Rhodopirellula islandica TaxID=595434 RepID=A0A0J1B8Q8_RHOIS|nr:FHA domain-containing protein [Rhodopirellula islandica]KLU02841.1 Forkhead-associated protein [Rhodopirellula islandica]